MNTTFKDIFKKRFGPWAIVTGASSGIGLAIADELAAIGLNLVLVARNVDRLNVQASSYQKVNGVKTLVLPLDLETESGNASLIQAVKDLDIGLFVASAGFGTSGLFIQNDFAQERAMMRLNMESLAFLSHHFAQRFAQNKRGGLVLLSSIVAFQGVPYASNYAATKAYVQTLAEGLSIELKPHNVSVLAAAPGPVETSFGSRANLKMNGALSPQDIALPILKALGKKTTVFPGTITKFLMFALSTVTRKWKVRIIAKVMGGMTAHQRVAK